MAEYIENVNAQTSKLDWAMPFQRTGQFPLDRSALFSSLADAVAYALGDGSDERKLGKTSYVGQPISVYENGEVAFYVIGADRTLQQVGSALVGDDKTIEVVDGVLKLVGIGEKTTGTYQPVLIDGELVWQEPSATTVEDLDTRLTATEGKITTIEGDITTIEGNITTINETLENVYNKEEVDGLVSGAFHFKGNADHVGEDGNLYDAEGAVITGKQGDVYQVGEEEYAYNGTAWVKLGFTLDLSAYATTASVTTAVNKAKEDAAADATAKADEAEADAIAAAATDAQTKADTALADAKAYADEKVGALNIGDYAKTEDVTSAIATAKEEAGTAANAYTDTKVGEVSSALSTLESSLGDLALKDKVAEGDLETALANKINGKADTEVVDGQLATLKTKLNNNIATAKAEAISAADTAASTNLTNKVGDIGDITVKQYVDNKETTINSTVSGVSTKVSAIETTIGGYGDIVTHNANEFAAKSVETTTIPALQAAVEKAQSDATAADGKAVVAQGEVDALETLVGTIPEGASATTVIGYIQEKTAGIATEGNLEELANRLNVLVGADENKSARTIANEEAVAEVTKLIAGAPENLNDLKEIADYISSDPYGTTELLNKVNANETAIATEASRADAEEKRLAGLIDTINETIANHEENTIDSVSVNGVALTVSDTKDVAIPLALQAQLGLVIGTDAENGISINDDHTMAVNSVNVNKLVQTEGEWLTLDGGRAAN